ncbi:hypothetical protein P1X15_07175 [Runella sp. MFBS21]|uniref:hypothetical protein n=1 Tax=Runella sp. MFBS21 TaxID=3034018 RepID=UPI0023F70F1D|nr:hypothetical protein [Runella sp. MFBS21]MDF7817368.1 hypothetical protein [Runella sp. MFBS21]
MSKWQVHMERVRTVMVRAWGLFRKGLLSLSLSLRVSWKLDKGLITEAQIAAMFNPKKRRK